MSHMGAQQQRIVWASAVIRSTSAMAAMPSIDIVGAILVIARYVWHWECDVNKVLQ